MKYLIIIIGLLSLFGCAAPSQILINPNTKHQVNCSSWGFGVIGTAVAVGTYYDCVNNQKALGYIPIEDFEKNESPKLLSSATTNPKKTDKPVWLEDTQWNFLVNGKPSTLKVISKETVNNKSFYSLTNENGHKRLYDDSVCFYKRFSKEGKVEVEFDPPNQIYDWPLYIGKTWNAKGKMKTLTGEINVSTQFEVKDFGKVSVPGGTFDAYYILGKSEKGARILEIWYSPEVEYYVKSISYRRDGQILEELTSFSHPGQSTKINPISKPKNEIEEKLETLNDLLKKGLITQEEYSAKKADMLNKL